MSTTKTRSEADVRKEQTEQAEEVVGVYGPLGTTEADESLLSNTVASFQAPTRIGTARNGTPVTAPVNFYLSVAASTVTFIAYDQEHMNSLGVDLPPTACMLGKVCLFERKFLANLPPIERWFIIGHEIEHRLRGHSKRLENRKPLEFNIACDININQDMTKIPHFSKDQLSKQFRDNACGLRPGDAETFGEGYSDEALYERIIQMAKNNPPPAPGDDGEGESQGSQGNSASNQQGDGGQGQGQSKGNGKGKPQKGQTNSKGGGQDPQRGEPGEDGADDGDEAQFSAPGDIHFGEDEKLAKQLEKALGRDTVKQMGVDEGLLSEDRTMVEATLAKIQAEQDREIMENMQRAAAIQANVARQCPEALSKLAGKANFDAHMRILKAPKKPKLKWSVIFENALAELGHRERPSTAMPPEYATWDIYTENGILMGSDPVMIPETTPCKIPCVLDTSGSVVGRENVSSELVRELLGLIQGHNSPDGASEIILAFADTAVRGVEIIDQTSLAKIQKEGLKSSGGGGTDFPTMIRQTMELEELKGMDVPLMIVFTDGEDAPITDEHLKNYPDLKIIVVLNPEADPRYQETFMRGCSKRVTVVRAEPDTMVNVMAADGMETSVDVKGKNKRLSKG